MLESAIQLDRSSRAQTLLFEGSSFVSQSQQIRVRICAQLFTKKQQEQGSVPLVRASFPFLPLSSTRTQLLYPLIVVKSPVVVVVVVVEASLSCIASSIIGLSSPLPPSIAGFLETKASPPLVSQSLINSVNLSTPSHSSLPCSTLQGIQLTRGVIPDS